jgi:NAD(P)-dependent dehydrogenase (short-subunit alcohol dehydrogenase family)
MTLALAAAGASVVIIDVDDEPIGETIDAATHEVTGLRGDVSSEADIEATVDLARRQFGRLDVIINNAGINFATLGGGDASLTPMRFDEITPAAVQRFFEVHVIGPFLLSRAAVEGMIMQGFGRIITVTTSLNTMTRAHGAPYGPMKAASEAFTASMAYELEGTGVTANVIIPGGPTATRLVGDVGRWPPGSLIDPIVMGPPTVWLASRQSDGVTAKRITAKNWDPSVPVEQAIAESVAPIAWTD